MLREIVELVLGVRDDGVGPGFPAGRTNLAVFVCKLECLHQTESLVHRSATKKPKLDSLLQFSSKKGYSDL